MKDKRIIFLGTPAFAVASLEALLNKGYNIVGVVTAPDKPAGRGMKLQYSAIKQFALEKGLNILQPLKLKDPDFINELKQLQADLQIVVAFRMLPEIVWNMPPLGTINVHGSLLPKYRGAAPIHWAIINGETETGVTTFQLTHTIDTGDILLQQPVPIAETETVTQLYNQLMHIGANVLVETVKGIVEGYLKPTPQIQYGTELPIAPKILPNICVIDFNNSVNNVYNFIRGLNESPGAFTFMQLNGQSIRLKIFDIEKIYSDIPLMAFQFIIEEKHFKISCLDGYINILSLQLEGKKKMTVQEFLNGYIRSF